MKKTCCILTLAALLAGSCTGFLDVNPQGEVFDQDMFGSAEGYEDALYGIYNELATSEALYGAWLPWSAEALSQNFTAVGDYQFGNLSLGSWYDRGPVNIREKIWSKGYECINHINNIIQHARSEGTDKYRHGQLYLGEALALRALVHFELIRLYGAPCWAGEDDKKNGIPYVEQYTFDITSFDSWDGTFEKIIRDLKEAETLLAEDETLVPAERTNSTTGFTDARITHLNLYAVQGLIARVYWTMGNLSDAALYAQKVVNSKKFSFRPQSAFVQPDNGTLDLHETIFGLYVRSQTKNLQRYRLSGNSGLQAFDLASDWKSLYEDENAARTDFRLTAWFDEGSATCTKLVNRVFYSSTTASYTGASFLGTNIIRLPEMYYILAEFYMNSDSAKAAEYFEAVTATRGREPLSTALTAEQLFRERRREFYGDGFTWHDMKRTRRSYTNTEGVVVDGSLAATYMLPIPDVEWEARNNVEI